MLRGVIPLAKPFLGEEEEAAVSEVLRSGMLVQGKRVLELEALVAVRCKRAHAVAVSSGTAALCLALKALGIKAGDRVLCPDLTWPSPAHAVRFCGAMPVLVDVDPDEWNATPEGFRSALAPGTRAAIVIDQFGNPSRAAEIAKALPAIPLVVDAACSLGSLMHETPCGALGEVACLSFHPRKVITTGEGGMCLTDDQRLADRIRLLRNHGLDASGLDFALASGNYRMSEMAAAIGIVQMARLEKMIEQRQELARRYRDLLSGISGLGFQSAPLGFRSNYQTFGVLLPEGLAGKKRDLVIEALAARGVQAGRLSFALHGLKSLRGSARQARLAGRPLETAAGIARRGLALPLYVSMPPREQEEVARALEKVLCSNRSGG